MKLHEEYERLGYKNNLASDLAACVDDLQEAGHSLSGVLFAMLNMSINYFTSQDLEHGPRIISLVADHAKKMREAMLRDKMSAQEAQELFIATAPLDSIMVLFAKMNEDKQ